MVDRHMHPSAKGSSAETAMDMSRVENTVRNDGTRKGART